MKDPKAQIQTAADRRSAETELNGLVAKFAPTHERLVGAVRRALRKRLPTAHEMVYEYRDCCVMSFSPSARGYEGVLAIRADAEGVKLYLNRGKGLPDPERLLHGSGSQVRWLTVEKAATLTRPAVALLIDEALARNEVPFAVAGRGSIVIRPTAAKQRQKRSSD